MQGRPRFSLVVMTYERPHALRRCLESLRRLAFPRSAFEVIVVDDGSVRHPVATLALPGDGLSLRQRWIPHAGVAAARNAGLAEASGEFVAFLADDYSLPADYLARAESFFLRYPEAPVLTFNVRCVGGGFARHVQQVYHELVLLKNAGADPDPNGVIRTFGLPASRAAVFRREVFDRVGPFDERLTAGEDGELAQRLTAHGIAQYFLHEVYIDHHEEKSLGDFLRQRRAYATSFYALATVGRGPVQPPRWPLTRCVRLVLERLGSWMALSRRHGKLLRFVVLWPGLALFLFRFYLTLHRLEQADLERVVATDPPEQGRRRRRADPAGQPSR